MNRRVVITGVGVINGCGEGNRALWDAAISSRTGISLLDKEASQALDLLHAGVVKDFSGRRYVANRKSLKVMCRDIQMAVAASFLAREDAGLKDQQIESERSGVCIGAGLFDHELTELSDCFKSSTNSDGAFDSKLFGQSGMGQLFPLWLLKYLPNMPACHISLSHGLMGPSNTIMADGSGSAAAFAESVRVIERGSADMMFCGGSECKLTPAGVLRYKLVDGLKKNGSSELSYPVFSDTASGMVLGEGSCVMIVEGLEHALKRNAPIYAEVAGLHACANTDEFEKGKDFGSSRLAAMEGALQAAGLDPKDVGALFLSAKGNMNEDRFEANAIEDFFGDSDSKPTLVTTKAITGYLGFAQAATDIACAAMSLRERTLMPSRFSGQSLLDSKFCLSNGGNNKLKKERILVNHFVEGLVNHTFLLNSPGDGGRR